MATLEKIPPLGVLIPKRPLSPRLFLAPSLLTFILPLVCPKTQDSPFDLKRLSYRVGVL